MKLDTTYLTPHERSRFAKERRAGMVTVYRARMCEGILNMDDGPAPCACPYEIPKIDDSETGEPLKRFCSKACHDAMTVLPKDDDDDENKW
jgi:hypothetical protein